MSTKKAREPRHFRVYEKVYQSQAWALLPHAAKALWLDLRTRNNGFNNGAIVPSFAAVQVLGWHSKALHAKALATLVDYGFIRYTSRAGPNTFRRASRVAFTDLHVPANEQHGIPGSLPTDDYLRFDTSHAKTSKRRVIKRNAESGSARFALPGYEGTDAPATGALMPRLSGNEASQTPRLSGNAKNDLTPRADSEKPRVGEKALRSLIAGDIYRVTRDGPPAAAVVGGVGVGVAVGVESEHLTAGGASTETKRANGNATEQRPRTEFERARERFERKRAARQ